MRRFLLALGLIFLCLPAYAASEVQVSPSRYTTVAASQTASVLGRGTINGILVVPATTSPGNVIIIDGATSTTVFAGGASSVLTLHPFFIPLNLNNATSDPNAHWKVTTGANVSIIVVWNR